MSKTTAALEAAVATIIENTPRDTKQTARQRVAVDRAFANILKLIAPRIRHFIRQYGLAAHWDDAEQCCAIAVHRAIEAYDPTKAQFTTFVNWQIRGELQSLRFRMMADQRPSARKVGAMTVSLDALTARSETEDGAVEVTIEDELALEQTEACASTYLAESAMNALIDAYVDHLRQVSLDQLRRRPRAKRAAPVRIEGAPRFKTATHGIDPEQLDKLEEKLARDREIVARRIFETATLDDLANETGVTKERVRQITKSAARTIVELTARDPRFALMTEGLRQRNAAPAPRKPKSPPPLRTTPVSLLPDPSAPHNRLVQVTAFDTVHAADAASGRIAQAGRTSLPEPFSIHLLAEEVPVHGSRTTH